MSVLSRETFLLYNMDVGDLIEVEIEGIGKLSNWVSEDKALAVGV